MVQGHVVQAHVVQAHVLHAHAHGLPPNPPLFPVTRAKDGTISTPVGCTIPELMN